MAVREAACEAAETLLPVKGDTVSILEGKGTIYMYV